jgi:hypothetical protein
MGRGERAHPLVQISQVAAPANLRLLMVLAVFLALLIVWAWPDGAPVSAWGGDPVPVP